MWEWGRCREDGERKEWPSGRKPWWVRGRRRRVSPDMVDAVFHLQFTVHPGRYRPQPMDRLSGGASGRFLTPASWPRSRRRRPAKVETLWRGTCMTRGDRARPRRSARAVMRYWRSWARFYRTVQRVLFKLLELRDRELHDAGIYSCAA